VNWIGIDFGTTKSVVSYFDSQTGMGQVIQLGRDVNTQVPTAVYVPSEGPLQFGDDALDQLALDPSGVLRGFKRKLHQEDAVPYCINGRTFSPIQLTVHYLQYLKGRSEEEHFHNSVENAVITVPAMAPEIQRKAMKEAANWAGFASVDIVDEPVAAAMAFLKLKKDSLLGESVLVFDWGGGTLDLAYLEKAGDGYRISADLISGNLELGGDDIDAALEDGIEHYLQSQGKSLYLLGLERRNDMRRRIEKLKKACCRGELGRLVLSEEINLELTTDEFLNHVSDSVDSALEYLRELWSKLEQEGKLPASVLLVGGSTYIPSLENGVQEMVGDRMIKWTQRTNAVGLGSAVYANPVIYEFINKKADKSANVSDAELAKVFIEVGYYSLKLPCTIRELAEKLDLLPSELMEKLGCAAGLEYFSGSSIVAANQAPAVRRVIHGLLPISGNPEPVKISQPPSLPINPPSFDNVNNSEFNFVVGGILAILFGIFLLISGIIGEKVISKLDTGLTQTVVVKDYWWPIPDETKQVPIMSHVLVRQYGVRKIFFGAFLLIAGGLVIFSAKELK